MLSANCEMYMPSCLEQNPQMSLIDASYKNEHTHTHMHTLKISLFRPSLHDFPIRITENSSNCVPTLAVKFHKRPCKVNNPGKGSLLSQDW